MLGPFVCRSDQQQRPTILLRDFDGKFVPEFDALLQAGGVEVLPVGPAAPILNAYAERWVLSVKSECLDHFVVLGEDHLRHLVSEYLIHYHQERPHQGKDNLLLTGAVAALPTSFASEGIEGEERLGGLLKHYRHRAA